MTNQETQNHLDRIISQFEKLGLSLDLTDDERLLLKTQALQLLNPKTNAAYCSNLETPLSYYLLQPHEDIKSTKSVLLLSGIHPNELAPLYSAWKILAHYLSLKDHSVIKNRIIFVPLLNPDCFIGSEKKEFFPTRKKENGIDLNRHFYSPAEINFQLPDFKSEPEIDFLLSLIRTYNPSHFVVTHSPLNFLELDGNCTKEDREWINRVHEESGNYGGTPIPIKKLETYAEKKYHNWSFGHFIKDIQKTALTFEYPGPKQSADEAKEHDLLYRNALQMSLDIDGTYIEIKKKEEGIIKGMSLAELAEYAHNHYGHPSQKLHVVGITGTNGKTTVSYLIGEVLKAAGHKPFVLGTLNSGNRDLSTPEAIDTLRLMREHLDKGGTHFVLEVTSEGIDQSRVLGIHFDIKILTNITQDHLDYHKTFEHYEKTKLGFMRDGDGYKIYPKDFIEESISFPTRLLGHFNLLNIKAAARALRHMGIHEAHIQKTLSLCSPPRGRLESVEKGQAYKVIIDYAHTPDALENVLNTLKKIASEKNGKLFVLFGCGGNRDTGKRPKMGKLASEIADHLVITDDNPRSEISEDIMNEIASGIPSEFENYTLIQNRKKAICFIVNKAQDNDVVILLGKGHETYQILKSETIHFDDLEEANQAVLLRLKNEALNTLS